MFLLILKVLFVLILNPSGAKKYLLRKKSYKRFKFRPPQTPLAAPARSRYTARYSASQLYSTSAGALNFIAVLAGLNRDTDRAL